MKKLFMDFNKHHFDGRITRQTFIYANAYLFFVMMVALAQPLLLMYFAYAKGIIQSFGPAFFYMAYTLFVFTLLSIQSFSLVIRRLHDMNQSGLFSLFMVVPATSLLVYIPLALMRGTKGANEYGVEPGTHKDFRRVLTGNTHLK